jgi:outer membrane immunogenic protein
MALALFKAVRLLSIRRETGGVAFMKSIILAAAILAALTSASMAADAVAELPVASTYNWTGGYIGIQAGGSWGNYHQFSTDGGEGVGVRVSNFTGGAYGGYNWQFDNVVVGVEADISNGPSGSTAQGSSGPHWVCGTGDCNVKIDYYGTVRGRLGYAVNNFLIYGTGGLAYGHARGGIEDSVQEGSGTRVGWTAGVGADYAFNANWVARAEYLHVDLGDLKFGSGNGLNVDFKGSGSFDTVRVGLAYKF